MKGLRIGRRRARPDDQSSSPLDAALRPALVDGSWSVPSRFNFSRDVVEVLASDPKRQALTFIGDDGVIEPRTFLEVAEGAARWASILSERGVRPDDRVLVLAGSSLHWLEIVLGVMKVGAVAVPCPPTLSASALEARVSSTDATLVVAEHACEAAIERMSFAPEVQYVDQGHVRRSSDGPPTEPTHDTSTRDLAFVFTSAGASGAPREIAHTHGAVFAARAQAEHLLEAGRGDVVWCTADADSPLYAWLTFVGPWSRGAEIVVHRGEFDARERLENIYRLGATILCQSPAEYRALAELPRLERFRSPRLRRLVSTGEFLEPEVREAFEERWNLTIHDGYGQAETGIFIAGGRENAAVPGAIGPTLPGYEAAIVDDQGSELPPGIEGDLALRGQPPTLFAGYWEAPDETKRAFRGDWYVTGDVALKDDEGRFVFVGRAEDVITSSGRTFGPYGVEHVLRSHGAVAAAAIVGMRDLQRGGHFVRAFVVPARGAEGSEQLEAELRRHVADVLPEQQVPREIVFVDALPVVAGKLSRRMLREQPISGRPLWDLEPMPEPEVAAAQPTTEQERPAAQPVGATPVVPPKAEPVAIVEPEPVPAVEPEPVAIVEPEPVPTVEPGSVPMAEPQPVAIVEPEPVAVVEPEPSAQAEPEPTAQPEPEPVPMEPEPIVAPTPIAASGEAPPPTAVDWPAVEAPPDGPPPAVEAEPVQPAFSVVEAVPEPEAAQKPPVVPELEPVAEHTPTPIAEAAPEPVSVPPSPEAHPEAHPESEPGRTPELTIAPSPETREPVRESEPEPARAQAPEAEPEPLPDFIIVPGREAERAPEPEPVPEPEMIAELEPLPDYIVDPSRPGPSRADDVDRRQAAEAPPTVFPGLVPPSQPGPEPSAAEAAGIYFPPVTSFPTPRDEDGKDDVPREARKTSRRRPSVDDAKSRAKRSQEEPGDDPADAGWMAGLSNRLSAYSLAEDDDEADDSASPPDDER